MSILYKHHDKYPESILIRDFTGNVTIDDIIGSWDYLIENNIIKPTIKGVINNISGCVLHMDMDGFSMLMNYLKKNEVLRRIKLAVVCDSPKMIVFPTLAEVEETELRVKPFTTEEAAVYWIMNSFN